MAGATSWNEVNEMASIARRSDGTYRPRFRDATGKEHARHFKRKVDAQRWLDEMTAAMVTGQYVDPTAGRLTLREYAEQWRAAQVHRPTTAAHVETMLRRHVSPALRQRRPSSVLPSDVQALVKRLSLDLAPSTVGVVHRILASIFKAAVRDRRIVASPCEGPKLPKVHRRRVEPLTREAVQALTDAVADRYRALVTLAAGTGLRQGEAFGLTVDRIDFLRRQLGDLVVDPIPLLQQLRDPQQDVVLHAASVARAGGACLHRGGSPTEATQRTPNRACALGEDRKTAVDSVAVGVADSVRTVARRWPHSRWSAASDGRVGLYAGFCPRAPCGLPMGGHPSRPAVAGRLQRSTRRHRAGSPRTPAQDGGGPPSLSTLLRVGFTEPHRSPGVRWSLTPPFHPYQRERWRSVLCGTVPRVTPGRR